MFCYSYGQTTAFTCQPCLPHRTAAALYAAAFIAALLLVRLLTWLTIVNNNASATTTTTNTTTAPATAATATAAATSQAPNPPVAPPAPSKAKDPNIQPSSHHGHVCGWGSSCLSKLCICCHTKSSTADGTCSSEAEPPSPGAAQNAFTSGTSTSSQPQQSSGGTQSTNTPSALKSVSSSVSGQGSAPSGGSYLAHASDIFRVLVLYIQVRATAARILSKEVLQDIHAQYFDAGSICTRTVQLCIAAAGQASTCLLAAM